VPTILTHPAVALLKSWYPRLPARTAIAGAALTIVADLDVIAFAIGIPYEDVLGHRGFTHSILFALLIAFLTTALLRFDREDRRAGFAFLFLCAMSHGVLDAFTDGGLGVAFFAPFHNARYFFAWTPVRVSPIGAGFFSRRGLETVYSELLWVWIPAAITASMGHFLFARRRA
jgi:inner membrane protein